MVQNNILLKGKLRSGTSKTKKSQACVVEVVLVSRCFGCPGAVAWLALQQAVILTVILVPRARFSFGFFLLFWFLVLTKRKAGSFDEIV